MLKIRLRRWAKLRFLIINGHVGKGFLNGILGRALSLWPRVDIVLIQEGRHAKQWGKYVPDRFMIYPAPRESDQPMTYVLYNRKRFIMSYNVRKDITHDGQYPRELDGVVLYDKHTSRNYSVSSFHVDPLGKGFDNANASARECQIKQTSEYVSWHEEARLNALPFSGGDTNNMLRHETSPGSVRDQFETINMVPLFTKLKNPGKVEMEDLFARFGALVQPVKRVYRWIQVPDIDHGVVYAVVKVLKL